MVKEGEDHGRHERFIVTLPTELFIKHSQFSVCESPKGAFRNNRSAAGRHSCTIDSGYM